MNDNDWLDILNSNIEPDQLITIYCLYKGKHQEYINYLLLLLKVGALLSYGITLNKLINGIINDICIEFNFIELRDKTGRLIKFYKNQQTNGKEIFKV